MSDFNSDKLISGGLSSFPEILNLLRDDANIDTVEQVEDIIKQIVLNEHRLGITSPSARNIAIFQKDLGLLRKYKSYTVKCATPVGYSIFLHNPGEGFSFQQHRTHKTELFHILKVKDGGFVFLCTLEQWNQYYDSTKFQAWLNGEPNPTYDQFTFKPQPGDVFVVDKVGIVHTVIGCELEEYANDSTDMVDRLHDQNLGKPIPNMFTKEAVREQLGNLVFPTKHRLIEWGSGGFKIKNLEPNGIAGGTKIQFANIDFQAARYSIDPQNKTEVFYDDTNSSLLHITQGQGELIIDEPISITKSNMLLIPPKTKWQINNQGIEALQFSEHKVPLEVAFHKFV